MSSLMDIFGEDTPPVPTKPSKPSKPNEAFLNRFVEWLNHDYHALQLERAGGIHASSLWKTCARQRVIVAAAGLQPEVEKLAAGNFLTFDVGHALHHWWQNNYLGPMGVLWGEWACNRCDKIVHTGFQPKACPICGASRRDVLVYAEYGVSDNEIGFTGHCDGVLKFEGFEGVFEFKTASATEFPKIVAPKVEHIVQAHAYMHCLKLKHALVVYQNKGRQCGWTKQGSQWIPGKPELKVFHIEFNSELWNTYAGRVREWHRADAFVGAASNLTEQDAKKWPRLCNSQACRLAEECPVVTQCFSLD